MCVCVNRFWGCFAAGQDDFWRAPHVKKGAQFILCVASGTDVKGGSGNGLREPLDTDFSINTIYTHKTVAYLYMMFLFSAT